jgi:hypothetical protein
LTISQGTEGSLDERREEIFDARRREVEEEESEGGL